MKNRKQQGEKTDTSVKQTKGDYSSGNQSPYREWVEAHGGNDPLDLEKLADDAQVGLPQPLHERLEDVFDALEDVYPYLKGRQKQILNLLLDEGVFNQAEIARRLGMKRSNVSIALNNIKKKLITFIQ